MDEWREVRLGDVCLTNTDSYSKKDDWDFVNYLDTGNITANCIDEIQYIDIQNKKLPSRAKRKVKYNSIIYSTVRPNQQHYGIIKSQPDHFLVSTGFTVIDVNSDIVDADFLYFLLSSNEVTEKLHAIAEQSVSAYPSIKASDIENLEVYLPPLDVQRKISSLLMCIEEKIAQNTAINKNLEEQLGTIYHQIFDKETEFTELGSMINTTSGGTPSRKRDDFYENADICWVKSKELSGGYIIDTEEKINDLAIQKSSAKMLPSHSILIAMYGATVGESAIIAKPMTCNQAICALIPNESCPYPYIYQVAKEAKSELINMAVGSAQQNISQVLIKQLKIHSNVESIKKFCFIAKPIHDRLESLCTESVVLADLRDTILPRLMSGEIDVSKIEV